MIEIGTNEITYKYKNETTTNIAKIRELATIIYSSGRIQNFKGLEILKGRIERDNQKKRILEKREKQKIKLKEKNNARKKNRLDFFNNLEIGTVMGITSNNIYGTVTDFWERYNIDIEKTHSIDFLWGLSTKHHLSSSLSIKNTFLYHIKGYNTNFKGEFTSVDLPDGDPNLLVKQNDTYKYHYISFPLSLQYNSHGEYLQWFVNSGLYMSYLLRGKHHVESTYETINPGKGNIQRYENNEEIDLENTNRFDLGPLAGGGLSYPISNQLRISIEGSVHLGLIDMNKNLDLKNYKHYSRHNYSYNLLIGCSYKLQENKKK